MHRLTAYSNSHGASRTSTYDNSEDLNLDAELAVENRFNLPQHEASTNHRSLQAAKSSAAGPVMPLDLDNTPAPRAPASTQRHIASEKAQAQEPTASTAQHSTMHDLKSTPTEQTAENSMTASMQDIKNQSDELQLQLNDTQQQNQHRAQYIKVLEHDVKQAQTQLQQLKIELQQARNETKRYVQATKKLNRKIKTINEKIKSTTRQIATTYEKQNGMKQELHKNLNEYKQKQQQLAR